MNKETLYPKTRRFSTENESLYQITEKLDGSNLSIANIENELYIYQRNRSYKYKDLTKEEIKQIVYNGLYGWLDIHYDELISTIRPDRVIIGEWLGMGKIKYDFDDRFFMFAKAILEEDKLTKIKYNLDHLKFAFNTNEIPNFISCVPMVNNIDSGQLQITILDNLYNRYSQEIGRNVEGFIITNDKMDYCQKYVRFKNGKATEHKGVK